MRGRRMVLNSTSRISFRGLPRLVTCEVIPADHEHFVSLAWPCMMVRWHHWHHKRSHVPFCFAVCLTVFPFEFRPRTFTIGFYRKKSIRSSLMILEWSFPLLEHHELSCSCQIDLFKTLMKWHWHRDQIAVRPLKTCWRRGSELCMHCCWQIAMMSNHFLSVQKTLMKTYLIALILPWCKDYAGHCIQSFLACCSLIIFQVFIK